MKTMTLFTMFGDFFTGDKMLDKVSHSIFPKFLNICNTDTKRYTDGFMFNSSYLGFHKIKSVFTTEKSNNHP